ncbi:unnamed protein product [Rotaria sp. Silwood2]|nr:unnamed protein product [Rotaria sp. Silwood2]CAF2935173.1 unnamed protein product [Rotaria sp. Silwood2]CAF3390503.1 unnamed protein product [Rotaria sp. Silwood2]CAF4653381.1 unnamed protein product [Rotaria sp. Silwood2]
MIVPPVPINRIHLPPTFVLNNSPLSQESPTPDVAMFREGSLTTVYDEQGGSPLGPPLPTSKIVGTVAPKNSSIKLMNSCVIYRF